MLLTTKSTFMPYFDFFQVANKEYEKKPSFLSKKILSIIANNLHKQYIEIEKIIIDLDKYSVDHLNLLCDELYDSLDEIKLLKSKIKNSNRNNFEYENLYNNADDLHNLILTLIEKTTSKEIHELKNKNHAA
ncbi:MAG: hypothetical protein QM482_06705 [Sulfurospirillum sp.]